MKYLIYFLILNISFSNYYLSSSLLSQENKTYEPKINKKEIKVQSSKSEFLLTNAVLPDSTRRDSAKTNDSKSWWEILLDFSFWSKLSGPGPFFGLGIEYPFFKINRSFALFIGTSFSNSFDNTLQYNKTVSRKVYILDTNGNPTDSTIIGVDSCIQCNKSRAVQMVSIMFNAQYRIPKSNIDVFLGLGLHTFFGETFKSFSRISGTFGAGWRVLNYIRVGLMVNFFEHFKPSKFGAVDGKDSTGSVEFIPGAFISISLH